MTDKEKEIILRMCEYDMNVSQVSRVMGLHRNSVEWHIGVIKRKTKLDALRFYDLVKLREMASDG